MSLKNTTTAWGWPARTLHWLMAIIIIGLLIVGTYMADLDLFDPNRYSLTQTHKSFGFVAFVLAVLRVGWRFANPSTPALPAAMPAWQKLASHASHYALYVLIFAMPLTGWLMASSSPLNDEGAYPTRIANKVFGLFEMPDPFPTGSEDLSEFFGEAHEIAASLMMLILLVHVAAALKHHFIDKDTILRRMIRG
ncbi:cytochrome b [Algicella marina]|uniref:Cytochrome b n=1 Tax=Algicella marina TaxID=2683284 RepID=A0A6P1T5R8_9RHOB|nr:cytochrome b [Algicella marina]QHQ37105.1 cytochrome b [Algicella marina]